MDVNRNERTEGVCGRFIVCVPSFRDMMARSVV